METRKVLVADASPDFCTLLTEILGGVFELRVCHDGSEALEQLDRFHPDVAVVDLALPGLDGLSVLKAAVDLSPRPACLATTRFSSQYIETAIVSLGIDYVVMKPCDIRALADRIADLAERAEGAVCILDPPPDPVGRTLVALGVSQNYAGYRCLHVAITQYMDRPGISMTKELYPLVAKECGSNPAAVERVIRTAIEHAWTNREDALWRVCFRGDRKGHIPRPTNSVFIASVSEHLRFTVYERASGA